LRDRAALGALLWPTGDVDAQGYEEIEARAASAYEHWVGSEGLSFRGRDDAEETLEQDPQFVRWKGAAEETELRAEISWPGDPERRADLNAFSCIQRRRGTRRPQRRAAKANAAALFGTTRSYGGLHSAPTR
jgi:hypothetical protein